MTLRTLPLHVLACIVFAALPAGCTGGTAAPHAKLAARVNGAQISLQEVASASAGGSGLTGLAADEGRQAALQALERVIDRELLVQQAIEARLDRDPAVVAALESARRQVLAQAWLERAGAAMARSTPEEVRAFYRDNPALFRERRIYRLRELAVGAPVERLDLLKAEAARAKDLDEVAGWLEARGAKFGAATLTQPAEQVPLARLGQLSRMKEGEIAVFSSALGASVVQLLQAQDAGLTEQQAAPLIEQFLAARKRLELAAAEVRRLRDVASIEYVGEFKRN